MSDLKLCPFCGNEVDNHKDDCYFRLYSVAFADSLVLGKAGMHVHVSARELNEAWNTRAERTCEMVYEPDDPSIHYGKWTCSECGHWWMYPSYDMSGANYCPDCGAKVERGES